jgi:N utilization substance protein B
MGGRHRAREYALQMLYQAEASGTPIGDVVAHFWLEREVPEEVRSFAERLAVGTLDARERIDALLGRNLEHWRLERLAIVDRNVLRLAVYEFLYEPGTPPIVVIDEAIEIAKRFGGDESGQFVNGILDALRKRLAAGGEEDEPVDGPGTSDDR